MRLLVLVLVCVGLGCSQPSGQVEETEHSVTGSVEQAERRPEWQRAAHTVRAAVTLSNNPPDAVEDTFSVAEDSSVVPLNVLTNDSMAPDTGETLTITSVTQPTGGTVSFTPTSVYLTPASNFFGTTTFTYTVSDGNGGTDTATVTAVVTAVNDPPDAMNDAVTVVEDSAATVVHVLANDSIAPDVGETLTVTAVTQPATGGTVMLSGGWVRFTPAANFSGTVTFTYTVSDGTGLTDTALVTVMVTPFNDPPTAVDDTFTVAGNGGTTSLAVLANDSSAPDTDETLTVVAVTQPANGTVTFTASNVSFTPAANFSGTVTFTYTVSDGNAGTATGTVTVVATPRPPVLWTPTNGSTTADNTPIYTGTAEPGVTVTVIVDGGVVGTSFADGSGAWAFTPTTVLSDGLHAVKATATDASNNTSPDSDTNTFTVDTAAPAAPGVLMPTHDSMTADNTPTYSGTAEPGCTVIVIVDGVMVGTSLADGAGTWSFTPITALEDGPHNVKASATDAAGHTSPASSLNVFTVDTAPSTGGWRPMGTLSTSRSQHTATLLSDGKILVVGGLGENGALASAELYDPNTRSWRITGNLRTARFGHTATLLNTGKVLVIGGEDAGNSLTSAELYDPLTESWSPIVPLARARASHTATLLDDGKVLVTGGHSSPGAYVADAEVYDLNTGWSAADTLTDARDRHTATLLPDGKVLVTGGYNSTTGELASAELYTPNVGWSSAGTLATARSSHTATLLGNGKVLITGGHSAGAPLTSVELYDPLAASWSQAGALSTPRRLHTATLLPSGRVLVTGGENSSDRLVSTEVYDPLTDIWSPAGALATARSFHTAMLVSGKVLIIGGAGTSSSFVASAEVFGSTGTSSLTTSLEQARTDFMAVLLPTEEVLVVGGSNSNGLLADAELYNPITRQWSSTSSLGTARASSTATLLHTGEVLVAGGKGPGGTGLRAPAMGTALASAELFNPWTKTWRRTGSLRAPRSSHSAVLLSSGKVLVIGGLDKEQVPLSTVEVYDPERETWRETRAMRIARSAPLVVQLPTGQVLVAGGMDKEGDPLASAELYDPEQDKWVDTEPMNAPRVSSTAVMLPTGQVLVAGGTDERQILNSAEIYEPAEGHWRPAGTLEQPRKAHSALLLPTGNVLVVGGTSGSSTLDDVEVFDLSRREWERKSRLTTPSKDSLTVMLPTGQVLVIAGTGSSGEALARAEEYGEHGDASTRRPVLEPLKAQKPLAFLKVRGSGFMESSVRPGMIRVQTLPGGELRNVHPQRFADSSLEMTLPYVSDGYHLLFVLVRGIAGGRVLRVDGTPPGTPMVEGYTATPQPAIVGTAEQNSTIQVLLSDGTVGATTADGTGAWSLLLERALVDGEHTASVTATDEAGNPSQSTTVAFIVDTRAPAPPSMELERTPTKEPKPTLSGTAEALSQITLFVDGRQEAPIQAGEEGYWSSTLATALEDGPHVAWAIAMDRAGNPSARSQELHFSVDTQQPATPEVLTPREGAIEPSRTPVISGTAEPSSTVVVKLDGEEAHKVTADAGGHWSFQPSTELEDKAHFVSALAMDEAGNSSLESTPRGFTVGGAKTFVGGGLSCATGPGDSSLVLLSLAALGRFLPRRRRARVGASSLLLLACVWLGCGPQVSPLLESFAAGERGAITLETWQQPLATPGMAATQAVGWSNLPGMSTTRYNHTVTLLPSGKVLVAGGLNASGGSALNSTQWYDPVTGAWRDGPSMITARYNHTTTLLPSGRILVAGGIDSQDQALGSFEVYDPEADAWQQPEALIQARYNHTATLLPSGEVLVTGGTQDGTNGLPDVEVYDPRTETWHSVDSMNHPRFRHTATLLPSGKVLVIGGAQVGDIEEYASGGTWTVHIGTLLTNRSGHTATLLPSGRILVAGGTADGGNVLDKAELYDRDSRSSRSAASMSEARTLHTATLLFSGKVLVAGGMTGSIFEPRGLSSAQEYEPEDDTWTPVTSLTSGRFQHAAMLLPSGKVLVTGGYDAQSLDSAEVYDPGRGRWGAELVRPEARSGHAVTLLPSGKVLITGGVDAQGRALDTFVVYDPVKGSWEEPQQTLRGARYHHTATLLPSGKVLITGGTEDGTTGLSSVEVYDPTTGIWRKEASMSHARAKHTATLLASGKVLVVGGGLEKDTEEYDPERHTWKPVGELTTNRSEHTATLLPSGKVLIIGGIGGGRDSLDTAELYDAENQQWSAAKPMRDPRFQHTATLLPSGKVLIAGGAASANTPRNSTELFDPATGEWTPGSLQTYRYAHTATLLPSGQVLIAGGRSSSTALSDAEVYDPVLGSWRTASSLNTARLHHSATLLPSGQVLIFGGENSGGPLASAQIYEGLAIPDAEDSRPAIPVPLPATKPGETLELTGNHLRSRSEASGGNARSAGSTLPLLSLIAVDGGGLTRIASLKESSDATLTFELPEVGTGYYVVSVTTQGLSGGQLVRVDGTPPPAPQVSRPLLGQEVFTSRPTITGTTEQGSKVKVSLRKKEAGEPPVDETEAWAEAQVDETGVWTYTPEAPLELGDQALWVFATDEVGNDSKHISIDFRLALPQSHYGWGCANAPALPPCGTWLLVLLLLRRVKYPHAARKMDISN